MKRLLIISLITFLHSCGYTSVYNDQEKRDLLINIQNVKGDNEINTFLKNELYGNDVTHYTYQAR